MNTNQKIASNILKLASQIIAVKEWTAECDLHPDCQIVEFSFPVISSFSLSLNRITKLFKLNEESAKIALKSYGKYIVDNITEPIIQLKDGKLSVSVIIKLKIPDAETASKMKKEIEG